MLNLETNQIVETCEVSFDETMPSFSSSFECAGDNEIGQSIFKDHVGGEEDGDDDDAPEVPPQVNPATPPISTTLEIGPSTTSTTSTATTSSLPQASQVEATSSPPQVVHDEAISRREAPRHIQKRHPSSTMIGGLDERVTRLSSRNMCHFAHSTFVASFEPRDIGHALSDSNWVNAMHEELENFERNQVWVLVEPPQNYHPIGTK